MSMGLSHLSLALGLLLLGSMVCALWWRLGHARRVQSTLQRQLSGQLAAHHEALQVARGTAASADLAKTRFLAAASHDLRQPAHALGLYLAALRDGPLATEQAEIAERMAASLAALQAMVDALLDISRIDAAAVPPRWDLLPLATLLRRLADEWAPAAEARGLRLALRIADPAVTVATDGVLLERVLRNLLANAVNYTRAGGVLLACRKRSAADGATALRIEVWDSGIGIAPADQARVFDEFHRVGNGRGHGLGLGLAIVQRLATLLQLRVTLHSRPGRGSVFFLDGLVPAAAAPVQVASARRELQRLAGTRVAVIEDDADVRDAMCRLLQRWDCEVLAGADAAEVLRQPAAGQAAHAVVADVHLAGDRRGPHEAQTLFAAWGGPRPLLLVSGEPQAGCWGKPVSPARLRAWLEEALQSTPLEPRA